MIRERAKFLLKDTALYGIANGASRFMTFLMIPVIVKNIDVAEFGIWNLLTILGSVIAGVAIMGMDSAVVRFYYEDESQTSRNRVFSNGLLIQLFLIALVVLTGASVPQWLLKPVAVDDSYVGSLYYVLLWVPAYVIVQYCQNWFKWTFQRVRFLVISLGAGVSQLVITGLYAASDQLNLQTVLLTQAMATWIFALAALWWCRGNLIFKIDPKLVRNLLHFGFPMMLILMASLLSPALDRIFLVRFLTPVQLGIYSFGQKLSIIMMVLVAAFQTAFGPFAYSIWNQPDAKETFKRFNTYYIAGAGLVGIGICCCADLLIMLLGTIDYIDAARYLPYLVMGAFVYGLYSFASLGLFYSRKMLLNLLSLALGLAVNFVLNIVLIPKLGGLGAAAGYMCGNLIMVTVAHAFSSRLFPVGYSFSTDTLLVVFVFVFMLAPLQFKWSTNVYLEAAVKVGLFVPAFLMAAFFLFPARDRGFVRRLFFARES
jgi:O-antigen/teichoic acid export membrane protein